MGPIAFAASFPYSDRTCYSGIGEFSVYVRREYRSRGAGRAALSALIEAATARLVQPHSFMLAASCAI
jgi:L-amino acid N-acyltransferase YncA